MISTRAGHLLASVYTTGVGDRLINLIKYVGVVEAFEVIYVTVMFSFFINLEPVINATNKNT